MNLFLLALLPFIGSLLPLLTARINRTYCALIIGLIPLAALLLLLYCAIPLFAGKSLIQAQLTWFPALGLNFSLRLDGLNLLFSILILGIGLLIIIYARYYLLANDSLPRFYSYLMLFMGSMLGIVLANNLLLLWFFWEMTSISSFLLISFWTHQQRARQGARMALTVTAAGGLCLLAGILLLGHVANSFDLNVILTDRQLIQHSNFYPFILIFILLGAFTKSAQFPFQFWLPQAMSAPTPVSAYLHSATMVKAGIFLLIRLYPVLSNTNAWYYIVTVIGLLTMFYGAYMAMLQFDLKALLAYSTVSHLGLITMLLGLDTPLATLAAIFHVVNHAIFKASLFMAIGIVDHECGSRDIRHLGGLYKFMPYTAILATVAAASMAGIPLLNGFLSKEMFLTESLQTHNFGGLSWLVPALATLGSALSVAYSLRLTLNVFYRGYPHYLPKKPHEAPRPMRFPIEILILLCLAVGIFPAQTIGPWLTLALTNVVSIGVKTRSLALWHGFNLPFFMSMSAIALGIVLYCLRNHLYSLRRDMLSHDSIEIFEKNLSRIALFCQRLSYFLDSGSLQRYLFFMLLIFLLFSLIGLLHMPLLYGDLHVQPLDGYATGGGLMMIAGALATVYFHRQLLFALIATAITELLIILALLRFSAPDLALTQLAVSTVTLTLMLLTLFFLPQQSIRISSGARVLRDTLLAISIGTVVGSLNFAILTQSYSTLADFYNQYAKTAAGGYNVVNVILVDFRGFDTFGEITVLAIAALAVLNLLNRIKIFIPTTSAENRPWSPEYYPTIFAATAQVLFPLALMISIYIFLRGHNLPGGGFIAGLIASSALIMIYMARGVEWTLRRLPINYQTVIACGLLLSVLIAITSWFISKPFLTSSSGSFFLPLFGEIELASALLFDLGVYLVVIGSTMMILANLGRLATPYSPVSKARRKLRTILEESS